MVPINISKLQVDVGNFEADRKSWAVGFYTVKTFINSKRRPYIWIPLNSGIKLDPSRQHLPSVFSFHFRFHKGKSNFGSIKKRTAQKRNEKLRDHGMVIFKMHLTDWNGGIQKSYTTRYKQADERQFRLIWFWQPAILTTADQDSMTSAVELLLFFYSHSSTVWMFPVSRNHPSSQRTLGLYHYDFCHWWITELVRSLTLMNF